MISLFSLLLMVMQAFLPCLCSQAEVGPDKLTVRIDPAPAASVSKIEYSMGMYGVDMKGTLHVSGGAVPYHASVTDLDTTPPPVGGTGKPISGGFKFDDHMVVVSEEPGQVSTDPLSLFGARELDLAKGQARNFDSVQDGEHVRGTATYASLNGDIAEVRIKGQIVGNNQTLELEEVLRFSASQKRLVSGELNERDSRMPETYQGRPMGVRVLLNRI